MSASKTTAVAMVTSFGGIQSGMTKYGGYFNIIIWIYFPVASTENSVLHLKFK
jgi:hypothetical protein